MMEILPTDLTPKEAAALQRELAGLLQSQPLPFPREGLLVAGADCSYEKRATDGFAAIVVCSWPSLEVHEVGRFSGVVPFPYVPGLLSFRELPLLDRAWKSLSRKPDLLVLDGQGYAHPRRFGLACHAGLLWDCPTLGCAKSLLVGEHGSLDPQRDSWVELKDHGETIGCAVRTRQGVQPVYVSIGHRSDINSSVEWILRLCTKYRLPEVTRLAHREVNRMRREAARMNQD